MRKFLVLFLAVCLLLGSWLNPNVSAQSLQSAITSIGSQTRTLSLPDGTYRISSNLTIPPNITMKPEPGAVFNIANGITLTINGPFEAGLCQKFSCQGTGRVVFGTGAVKEVYPEWWATNRTPGTTDMTMALNAALLAVPANGKVVIQDTSYGISHTIILVKAVNICGAGVAYQDRNGGMVGPTLNWIGGANPVISIVQQAGINLSNLLIQCNGKATYGINVDRMSASTWRNVLVESPTVMCVNLYTNPAYQDDNVNFNRFEKLNLRGPIGLTLDSANNSVGDCCLNSFEDLQITYTGVAGLQVFGADSNWFYNTYMYRNSGTGVGLHMGNGARDNFFIYLCTTGGAQIDAPISGASPYWTNTCIGYDLSNSGGVPPTIASGAYFFYTTTTYDSAKPQQPPRWNLPAIGSIYSSSLPGFTMQNVENTNTSGANPTTLTLYNSDKTQRGQINLWSTGANNRGLELETNGGNISLTPGGVVALKVINRSQIEAIMAAPSSSPANAGLFNSSCTFYLDETGNRLMVKVKYSNGTVKTGTVCIVQ